MRVLREVSSGSHHLQMNPSGASIPLRPWCIFPLCFRFPPVFEKNVDFLGNFWNFTFSRKNFIFSSAKISDDLFFLFLVIDHKFRIPPCFACFTTFPPLIRENVLFPLTFQNFPSCFRKIQQLFTYFTCNFSPLLLWPWCIYWTPLESFPVISA